MPFFGKKVVDRISSEEDPATDVPEMEDDGGYAPGRGFDKNFFRDMHDTQGENGSWFDVVPGDDGTWVINMNHVGDNGEWSVSAPAGGFETEDDAWGWLFGKQNDVKRHEKRAMGRYYNSGVDWKQFQHPKLRGE